MCPIQVAGLKAGVSFCCTPLDLSTPLINCGNTEAEEQFSFTCHFSLLWHPNFLDLTPWKAGRHGPGFKMILCLVAKPLECLCCLCKLLACFWIVCFAEPLGLCAVCICFNEVFASQFRSCVCSCCLLRLWGSVGFHGDFAPETMQKPGSWPLCFSLAQPAAMISSLLADHEQWTARRHKFLKSLCCMERDVPADRIALTCFTLPRQMLF